MRLQETQVVCGKNPAVEAFIKKTSDPDKLKVLKTNISKRYKDEKITEKDRDNLLSLILQKDD